jgi:hypothetical protein
VGYLECNLQLEIGVVVMEIMLEAVVVCGTIAGISWCLIQLLKALFR